MVLLPKRLAQIHKTMVMSRTIEDLVWWRDCGCAGLLEFNGTKTGRSSWSGSTNYGIHGGPGLKHNQDILPYEEKDEFEKAFGSRTQTNKGLG